ncbi:MAG: hypothetical protein IT343_01345 [Candidatus Melainabacteria bacterium]|jgi:hypothetical protein|nr:hypothetical protein [Candidatus Melainabacteria bacterium]
MTFPNQPSFKSTIEELKDAVNRSQGADHESVKLISQIEAILEEIESKMRPGAQVTGVQMQPSVAQESFTAPQAISAAPIIVTI